MTRGTKEWRTGQGKLQAELNTCLSELAELGLSTDIEEEVAKREREDKLRNIAVRLNQIYSDESFRHRFRDSRGNSSL